MATSLEYQQKLFVREGTKSEETPIKITFKLLSEAERAKLANTVEGAPLFPNDAMTEAVQAQTLADLKSGDKGKTLRALILLGTKDPAKPDKEMAQALEGMLADKDVLTRTNASRALIRWASADSSPALVKALDDENVLVRHNAMDALGRLKTDDAATAVAARLSNQQDRFKAGPVLSAMGPVAEPAVLKLADDKEWMVRSEVCKILKAVGTQKSVAALTAMQNNDTQPLVKLQAKQALEAIAGRK
jgi:HEAT repeat protein